MAQRRRAQTGAAKWLRGGRDAWSEIELARLIAEGVPVSVLASVVERGILTRDEVTRLIIPRRTLAHRKRRGERLSPDESDRLVRVLHLHDAALRTFDATRTRRRPGCARQIVRCPARSPLELIVTSTGARLVEDALLRIEHGVYT